MFSTIFKLLFIFNVPIWCSWMSYIRLFELNMRGLPRVETCIKIEDSEVARTIIP
jgi:hypothetical protein